MLKCYKNIFTKKKIMKNKGFFIFFGLILLNLIFLFIFCLKYFDVLKDDIKKFKFKILNRIANDMINTTNQNNINRKNISNKRNKIKKNNNSENINETKSNHKENKKIRNNIFTEFQDNRKKQ